MGCIVCATRGGEGSRAVQRQAMARARELKSELIYLYVVDFNELESFDEVLKPAVRTELYWLGRTLLGIAGKRAQQQDIAVNLVIREGNVRDEIARFLQESTADLLLLGAPRGTTANVFGDDAVEQFAQSIQEISGISVEVIRPEDESA